MRLVFAGTPDVALPSLDALNAAAPGFTRPVRVLAPPA